MQLQTGFFFLYQSGIVQLHLMNRVRCRRVPAENASEAVMFCPIV